MTYSETKFRKYISKQFDGAYIKKIPDYKQTGGSALKGLPDFLVIHEGYTIWYEVKYIKSERVFSLSEINDNQWLEFSKMQKAGAMIKIAVLTGKGSFVEIPFAILLKHKQDDIKSIYF